MPSYLDLGLIVVVLISALLSMLRGFTREVLAIASWAAAAAAAYLFHPMLLPTVKQYISNDKGALAVAAASIFLVTLVIVSIITVKISDLILDSRIGALDRSLGFLFGAGRGFLLCAIAFIFFAFLVPEKSYPTWVQNSKTRSWLEATGASLERWPGRCPRARHYASATGPAQPDPARKFAAEHRCVVKYGKRWIKALIAAMTVLTFGAASFMS